MWRTQRVRGNNFNPLVDFVILAEFDIDSGSTVRHIYPRDVPGYKSDWFADFMLPEGAHNRVVDYTYIILNRDAPQIDQHLWLHPASRHPIAAAAPSLTSPSPSFSATADRQFFPADDSTGSADSAKEGKEPSDSAERYMLYGLNIVKTRHDSSVRRGAIVKAMAIFSKYHFIESLKRPLEHAIDRYFEQPERAVLEDLFISLNAVDLRELPRPSYLEQCLMRRGVVFDPDAPRPLDHVPASWTRTITYYRFTGGHGRPSSLKGKEILMRVPLYRTPDEVGDICVMLLVKTFGDAVMRIYHAILMKQRVLFVGYNHAASEVAQMVLSAVAMVAPPLSNIIRRAYPYSNLSDLGFLEVMHPLLCCFNTPHNIA